MPYIIIIIIIIRGLVWPTVWGIVSKEHFGTASGALLGGGTRVAPTPRIWEKRMRRARLRAARRATVGREGRIPRGGVSGAHGRGGRGLGARGGGGGSSALITLPSEAPSPRDEGGGDELRGGGCGVGSNRLTVGVRCCPPEPHRIGGRCPNSDRKQGRNKNRSNHRSVAGSRKSTAARYSPESRNPIAPAAGSTVREAAGPSDTLAAWG